MSRYSSVDLQRVSQHHNSVISQRVDEHDYSRSCIEILLLIFNMYHYSVISQRVEDTRILTVISKDSSVDLQHVSQQCCITTS